MRGKHLDSARVARHFAGFPQLALLVQVIEHGIPVDVLASDAFEAEQERPNYPSARIYRAELWKKVQKDLDEGRVLPITMAAARKLKRWLRLAPSACCLRRTAQRGSRSIG